MIESVGTPPEFHDYESQLMLLGQWLAMNEPDIWRTSKKDIAERVMIVLEKYLELKKEK